MQSISSNPVYTNVVVEECEINIDASSSLEDESIITQWVRCAKRNKVRVILGTVLSLGVTSGIVSIPMVLLGGGGAFLQSRNITTTTPTPHISTAFPSASSPPFPSDLPSTAAPVKYKRMSCTANRQVNPVCCWAREGGHWASNKNGRSENIHCYPGECTKHSKYSLGGYPPCPEKNNFCERKGWGRPVFFND